MFKQIIQCIHRSFLILNLVLKKLIVYIGSLTYKKVMNQANFASALLLTFWIPFSKNYLTIFIGFWVLTWLLEGNFIQRFKNSKLNNYQTIALFLPIILYVLNVFSLIISENKELAIFDLEVKVSLLLFPLLFLGTNDMYRLKRSVFLKVFVLGLVTASFVCIANAFYNSIHFNNGTVDFNTAISPYKAHLNFFELIGNRFSTFSYTRFSIFHHPSYYALYLSFGVVSAYYLYRTATKKILKTLYSLSILLFTVVIYFLSSRAGLIALFIVIFTIMIIEILLRRKIIVIILSLIYFFVVGVALLNSKLSINFNSVIEQAKESENINDFIDYFIEGVQGNNKKKEDARLTIWRYAYDLAKDNPLTGVGIGDVKANLYDKYKQDNYLAGIQCRYNAHNQYLETFIAGGYIMLIALLVFLIFGMYMAIARQRYILGALMFLVALNMAFESMFNTMAGTIFIMFFYSLLVRFDLKSKTIKEVKNA